MNKHFLSTSTFFVSCLCYFFALIIWTSINSFSALIERWCHNSEMTIYLKPESQEKEVQELMTFLGNLNDQIQFDYQTSEKIKETLKRILPKNTTNFSEGNDIIATIPPHIIVQVRSTFSGASVFDFFKDIQNKISQFTIVETSSYGKSWSDKYDEVLKSSQKITLVALLFIGFTLVLVIGNSIRSHIYSQKDEIEILELVGATQSNIRRPFLIQGTLLSVSSMLVAIATSHFLLYNITTSTSEFFKSIDISMIVSPLQFGSYFFALLFSATIGYLGSLFCLNEINTGWSSASNQNKSLIPFSNLKFLNIFNLESSFKKRNYKKLWNHRVLKK